jgi:hypothetical protein
MRYILAVLAAITWSASGLAAECIPVSKVKADAAKTFPTAAITEMGGDETRGFILAFNAVPPVSTLVADYIVTVSIKEKPIIVIVLFSGGCAGKTIAVPSAVFNTLMRSL